MIEYVYRPVRTRKGKRVVSPLYSGRYSLGRGEKPVTVPLHVTDRKAAVAKLRALVVEREREAAGIIAPKAMREAATALLDDLVTAYAVDLRARTVPGHAAQSEARLRRILVGTGWKRLADATPSSWVEFRANLAAKRAAKTVKEYQTSLVAFFGWLVRMDMLPTSPLRKVDQVKTQGKSVRQSRAFTREEMSALLATAPAHRRIVYLLLGYTGLRKAEARGLLWSEVDLAQGLAKVRGKGGKARVVPLRPELVDELRPWCGSVESPSLGAVFPHFPSDDALHADLRRAGVERKNGAGLVLHWHAFRKTFVTWAAVSGVGQRSAQAVVGHSTPTLTANVYTDVEALPLRNEVAKLPWLGGGNGIANDAQTGAETATPSRFRALLGELITLAQVVVSEGKTEEKSALSLAARHGFEP